MCLGIPGKIVEIHEQDGLRMGRVEFGGIVKEACLDYTPEAQIGDYVLVHVGFAISRVDEAEAQEVFDYLRQIEAFGEPDEVETSPAANTPQKADRAAGADE
jgi:hydrogenase expression/formation protein HypC